jgi:hypothetical protein
VCNVGRWFPRKDSDGHPVNWKWNCNRLFEKLLSDIMSLTSLSDPDDFSGIEVILTFDQITDKVCATIPIEDDDISENPEDFPVTLTSDDPDVSSTRPMSTVTIIDNDNITVGFEMETYSATENQGTVEVCARLIKGTLAREAVITLQTESGSAQAPDDYTSVSVALTFDASTDRQCQDIVLTNDDTLEGVEEFEAVLETEEDRVTLSPERALVNISDDDCKYGELLSPVIE